MTVKQRLLAIRLSEHIRRHPEYAKRIGLVMEGREDGSAGKKKPKETQDVDSS